METMEKNNKTLNVPHLRFPEFSGEWKLVTLKEVADFANGKAHEDSVSENGKYILINSKFISTEGNVKKYTDMQLSPLYKSQIVMVMSDLPNGKALAKCYYINEDNKYTLNQRICSLTPTCCDSLFLLYQINRNKYYLRFDDGVNQTNLKKGEVLNCPVYLPSSNEQQKISALLSLLDQRIETQRKIIEKYESLIIGLITYVNKGKVWKCKTTALRDVLTEVHEKNVENYEVCSVSVSHGVINQIDYLGRSFAAKEVLHYNVVHYGDLVYTKSPTGEFPYGIVKRSNLDKPVAVSPLYGVYRPVNDNIGIYLHLYFKSPVYTKNYLHSLIQKGAKNTINITNQHFLNNKIQIPEPDVLEIFVQATSEIEKKIQAENRVLASFEKQKNYLLSKMFI